MMKKLMIPAAAALVLGTLSTTMAAGEFDRQIKARQAVMQLYAFNLGQLGAMAKGDVAYDAEKASAAAANLDALVNMKNGAMWPQGSHMKANPGVTWAKEENWTMYPKAAEKGMALKAAAATMALRVIRGYQCIS